WVRWVDDDGGARGVDDRGAVDVVVEGAAVAAVALAPGEPFDDFLVADGAIEDEVGGTSRSGEISEPDLLVCGACWDPGGLGASAAVECHEGKLCSVVGSTRAAAVVASGEA